MENEMHDVKVNEVEDTLARESVRKLHATAMELKAKTDFLAMELEKLKAAKEPITQSPKQEKLLEALAAAKADMSNGGIERTGYIQNRGSYATLDDMREFVDPILSKHGLSFRVESTEDDCFRVYLGHSSGQWYSSTSKMKVDYSKGGDAIQAWAKALTSMKRYAYGTFFMLHTGGDKD